MKDYSTLINEAISLMKTFTISYDVQNHENELFSSTYDEVSGWVRKALKLIEVNEDKGKECEIYKKIRKYRGRAGDITLVDLQNIVGELESINKF